MQRRDGIALFLLTLVAAFPLLWHGASCGHDFVFHLQSWLEAASQMRHGILQPHWAYSAAYNAGEPRFVFYPPLSWMLGGLLTLILPFAAVPVVYVVLALLLAAVGVYRCARDVVSAAAAVPAAALYVANPYMLFNAYERTAFAELLAAAWFPLLFRELLRERIVAWRLAIPVALLWLTNAPAGVMGSYTVVLVLLARVGYGAWRERNARMLLRVASWRPLLQALPGMLLGLALTAFYLLPAAYERRWVQIDMAVIPNMRIQDNFLFARTGDPGHDGVLHSVSWLATTLLAATVLLVGLLYPLRRRVLARPEGGESRRFAATDETRAVLCVAALAVLLLLLPLSLPVWMHLPELRFLQFPWRLLSVCAVVFALAGGATISALTHRRPCLLTALCATVLAAGLTSEASKLYRQGCQARDVPAYREQRFIRRLGVEPTDEYTPGTADNDVLRSDDPPWWLSTDPASFAPGTTPNPLSHVAGQRNLEDPVEPAAGGAPTQFDFTVRPPQPEFLIINLRQYPAWEIKVNGKPAQPVDAAERDDGLTVLAVPAGEDTVHIGWTRTPDQWLGLGISGGALAAFGGMALAGRSRRINRSA